MAKVSAKAPKTPMFEKLMPVLIVLSIGLAFMVGVLWQKVQNLEKGGVGTTTTQNQPVAQAQTVDIETVKGLWDKNVIKFGDKDKKVLFVEVADPSCPFCHVAGGFDPEIAAQMDAQTNRFKYVTDGGKYQPPTPEMKKLVDSGVASFAYIYFPGHGNGEMAMKALYCAFDQGKFWEAHDLLMTKAGYDLQNTTVLNDKTKSQIVVDFLKGAVNGQQLKSCLDSGKYDARLTEETKLSQESLMDPNSGGTPTFLVNTTRFNGAYSYSEIKPAVDAALK